jgi:hypothetical protein
MRYGALVTSRRIHASATVSVSVVIESTRQRPRAAVDATEPDDQPELDNQMLKRFRGQANKIGILIKTGDDVLLP